MLYDQLDNLAGWGFISQNFATLDQLDSQAADDFVVPPGETWLIDTVQVSGFYDPGVQSDSVNVEFLSNAGTVPGTSLASVQSIDPSGGLDTGSFVIPIDPPVQLSQGTYWVSVQANQAGEEWWYWQERTTQAQNKWVWRNPANGFGTGCTSWTHCPSDPDFPDLAFRILGEQGASLRPVNDDFVNAYQIPSAPVCQGTATSATCIGDTQGATAEPGEPNPIGAAGGSSIWYRWQAPVSGYFSLDTNNSEVVDTVLGIYTGAGFPLTFVDDNDDSGVDRWSIAVFFANAGVTYHIMVDQYGSTAPGGITLKLSRVVRPCPGWEVQDGVHIRGTSRADNLAGTAGDDIICGLGGNDEFYGGEGDDVLLGGYGDDSPMVGSGGWDTIYGGPGSDKARGGPGDDFFDGGPGSDWADYSTVPRAVSVNLKNNSAKGDGTDELVHVENVLGSAYADEIKGTLSRNLLHGGGGADSIFGLEGDDDLYGENGADYLSGGPGSDACYPGLGPATTVSCEYIAAARENPHSSGRWWDS